jgi:hypothetical protein
MRQQLGSGLDRVGEIFLEGVGDPAVHLLSLRPRQHRIGRIPNQRVLENVRCIQL